MTDPYAIVRDAIAALSAIADLDAAPPSQQLALLSAARAVLAVYADKDPGYGGSWGVRGEIGAFHNVARKFDRLAHAAETGQPFRRDDLIDLATYALLLFAKRLYQGEPT